MQSFWWCGRAGEPLQCGGVGCGSLDGLLLQLQRSLGGVGSGLCDADQIVACMRKPPCVFLPPLWSPRHPRQRAVTSENHSRASRQQQKYQKLLLFLQKIGIGLEADMRVDTMAHSIVTALPDLTIAEGPSGCRLDLAVAGL